MDFSQQQCGPTPEPGNNSAADQSERTVVGVCILVGLIGVAMLLVVVMKA